MKLYTIIFLLIVVILFAGCSTGTFSYITPFIEKQDYSLGYSDRIIMYNTDFQSTILRDKKVDIASLPTIDYTKI